MFSKGLQATIEDTLDYIETNIGMKITLDQLSKHSHLSKYHLHRILSQAVGMPIIDYIGNRTTKLGQVFIYYC